MTEKEKFSKYFETQKKNGVDIKLFPNYENLKGATEEALHGELNRMIEAVEDKDLFPNGKYEFA